MTHDRCSATTWDQDGIRRCQLAVGHNGGHIHEFGDGMAVGWGGEIPVEVASLKPGEVALIRGTAVKIEVLPGDTENQ